MLSVINNCNELAAKWANIVTALTLTIVNFKQLLISLWCRNVTGSAYLYNYLVRSNFALVWTFRSWTSWNSVSVSSVDPVTQHCCDWLPSTTSCSYSSLPMMDKCVNSRGAVRHLDIINLHANPFLSVYTTVCSIRIIYYMA